MIHSSIHDLQNYFQIENFLSKRNVIQSNLEYAYELDKNKIVEGYKVALFNLFNVHWWLRVAQS